MILLVTNKIKNGEIVFPTIGYPVKAGIKLTITDEQFYSNDIQSSLRKGFLEIFDKQNHESSPSAKKIKVTNVGKRPLGVDKISLVVGESAFISEKELLSTNVQTCINAGILEIEEPETPEQLQKMQKKSASSLKTKAEKEKLERLKKQATKISEEEIIDEIADKDKTIWVDDEDEDGEDDETETDTVRRLRAQAQSEPKAAMQSWDPYNKRMLNKEQSNSKVAKVLKPLKPKASKEEPVVTKKGTPLKDKSKKINAKNTKPGKPGKRKSLSPVGNVRPEPTAFDEGSEAFIDNDGDDITFVDREQARERIKTRPDIIRANIARKIARQNEEIE